MRFCEVDNNRLRVLILGDQMIYECTRCMARYAARPEDTLRVERRFEGNRGTAKYDTLLRNAAFDMANPVAKKICPECKATTVRYVVVGDEMRYIYVCTCGHRF